MAPSEYLFMQMELEGKCRVGDNLIAPAGPTSEGVPLVLLARTSDGESLTFPDASIPSEVKQRLILPDLAGFSMETSLEARRADGLLLTEGHYRTYVLPEALDQSDCGEVVCCSQNDPAIVAFGFHGLSDEVYAIKVGEEVVAACVSSRQDTRAAEAWVYVHPDHRRRGLARKVVKAWACGMRAAGRTPFYSHLAENESSAALAMRLGLTLVFEEKALERESAGQETA